MSKEPQYRVRIALISRVSEPDEILEISPVNKAAVDKPQAQVGKYVYDVRFDEIESSSDH